LRDTWAHQWWIRNTDKSRIYRLKKEEFLAELDTIDREDKVCKQGILMFKLKRMGKDIKIGNFQFYDRSQRITKSNWHRVYSQS
jgi:hypothetical protein